MGLTRRAALGGALGVLFWRPARGEGRRLEAGAAGYNGGSPGPLLRFGAGERLKVRLANRREAATSLALPGGAFPGLGAMSVAPGAEAEFDVAPAAPGFWLYGDYGGLYGPLIIDEAAPPAVDLDATAIFSDSLVNGAAGPLTLAAPPGGRVRLRLANASPEATVVLKTAAAIQIVAIDGQPCEMFAPRGGEFPLAPSSRFELMWDLGDEAAEFAAGPQGVLRVEPKGARAPAKAAPAGLALNPALPGEIALERALRVSVAVTGSAAQGFAMNGVGGTDWPGKPLFRTKRGEPVSLTLTNKTESAQTLRIEGHSARQLHALDDGWDPYWRDAFFIAPGRTAHAAFVASAKGKWPLASASPDKRAKGMKGWFEVG